MLHRQWDKRVAQGRKAGRPNVARGRKGESQVMGSKAGKVMVGKAEGRGRGRQVGRGREWNILLQSEYGGTARYR